MLLVVELVAAAVVLRLPARGPADAAPLVVGDHRTVELVNLGGSPGEALLGRIAAEIGAAVTAVQAFWGPDWSHQITVVATGSDQQFAAQAGGDAGQWAGVAAVAVADQVDVGRRSAAGQRIVFAPGAAQMSTAALRIVLGHELFHFASRADTAFDAPRWLAEGVADFVARGMPAPGDRPAPLTLPADAELDAAGPQRSQAYDRAWWFAGFIADRYGTTQLRRLYLAACGPGHADVPTALRRVLGVEVSAVLAGWQHWRTG